MQTLPQQIDLTLNRNRTFQTSFPLLDSSHVLYVCIFCERNREDASSIILLCYLGWNFYSFGNTIRIIVCGIIVSMCLSLLVSAVLMPIQLKLLLARSAYWNLK